MPKQRGRRRRQRKEGAASPSEKPAPEARPRGERREAKRAPKAKQGREARKRAAVSPLAFWRRARPRTYREQPPPRRTVGRLWRRVAGFYFPPWVPVAVVIGVVGFILLAVIVVREGGAVSPLRGDHWHASYEMYVCGTRQPQLPQFPGGVHTHGDGIIHIHPQQPFEEGTGARLVRWFEYAGDAFGTGGRLSPDTLQIPGQTKEYRNGDACPDGQTGVVQVYVNGQRRGDF
ncbi:MAG TPA: hypothetical protein VJ256_07655, partial [Dehalococcoidia bacterium]|nr:hypothetical protein [Dehalococcoidia bacterium]